MSDSYSPSFAKIGFVVVFGVLAIVGAMIYLGGLKGKSDLLYAETYFVKSVSGLSVGSSVNFRGVKIGEVVDIGFVGSHYRVQGETNQLIYVKMAMPREEIESYSEDARFHGLKADQILARLVTSLSMRAMVKSNGITGLSNIELDNMPEVPPLEISWRPECVYLPPAPSLFDDFADSATKVMHQINRMDLTTTWSNMTASVEAATHTLESAQTMMETRQAEFDVILSNAAQAASDLRILADELKANPSLLVRERIPEPLPETRR